MPTIPGWTLGAALLLAATSSLHSQEAHRLLTTGTAERSLRPDRALVRIGIETHAATAGQASALLSTRLASVQDSLRHFPAPLDSIRNIAFNVGPNYDYEGGKKLIDYEASAIIQLSIRDLDRLGSLVDVALLAGATDIPGMTFQSDSAEVVRRTLLATALADAKADASALATAGGMQLGPLVHIATLPPSGVIPRAAFGNAFAEEISIQPGVIGAVGPRDVPVRVAVYTTWELRSRPR